MDRADTPPGVPLYRFRFGAAEFDEARFELSVGKLPVDMEQKPLQVLAALLHRAGELVTREELLETPQLEDARRVLEAALAERLEGKELTTRKVARAVARRGSRTQV